MIVYDKRDGRILAQLPDNQDMMTFFFHYPQETKNNLDCIFTDMPIGSLKAYKVINGILMKRPAQEIEELELYNKILTIEERLLNNLKPSPDEIQKAKNTIEILTLIQEVM